MKRCAIANPKFNSSEIDGLISDMGVRAGMPLSAIVTAPDEGLLCHQGGPLSFQEYRTAQQEYELGMLDSSVFRREPATYQFRKRGSEKECVSRYSLFLAGGAGKKRASRRASVKKSGDARQSAKPVKAVKHKKRGRQTEERTTGIEKTTVLTEKAAESDGASDPSAVGLDWSQPSTTPTMMPPFQSHSSFDMAASGDMTGSDNTIASGDITASDNSIASGDTVASGAQFSSSVGQMERPAHRSQNSGIKPPRRPKKKSDGPRRISNRDILSFMQGGTSSKGAARKGKGKGTKGGKGAKARVRRR